MIKSEILETNSRKTVRNPSKVSLHSAFVCSLQMYVVCMNKIINNSSIDFLFKDPVSYIEQVGKSSAKTNGIGIT